MKSTKITPEERMETNEGERKFNAMDLPCPPCRGNCRQGRDCPADFLHLSKKDKRSITRISVGLIIFVGMLIGFAIAAFKG